MRKKYRELIALVLSTAMVFSGLSVTALASENTDLYGVEATESYFDGSVNGEAAGDSDVVAEKEGDEAAAPAETDKSADKEGEGSKAAPEAGNTDSGDPQNSHMDPGAEDSNSDAGETSKNPAADVPGEDPAITDTPQGEGEVGIDASFPGEESIEPEAGSEGGFTELDNEGNSGTDFDMELAGDSMEAMESAAAYLPTVYEYTYDGKPHKPELTYVSGDSYATMSEDGIEGISTNIPSRTAAGTTTVNIKRWVNGVQAIAARYEIVVNPRPITYKSETLTKMYDGKPLSNNGVSASMIEGSIAEGEAGFRVIPTTLSQTEIGSIKNDFELESISGNTVTANYLINKEVGDMIVYEQRGEVNDLQTPQKVKAVIDNVGRVKLSWKAVKTYKRAGYKKKKATYDVYRYQRNGTWLKLNHAPITKTNYLDVRSGDDGDVLVYKIIAFGVDASGNEGECETPAYKQVTPKLISVLTQKSLTNFNVRFINVGPDNATYTLQFYDKKSKNSKEEKVILPANIERESYGYKTAKMSKGFTVNNYVEGGTDYVPIKDKKGHSYAFRIQASEFTAYDYGNQVSIPASSWTKWVTAPLQKTAPKLSGERVNNTKIKFTWTKVADATGYLLELSKDPTFPVDGTEVIFMSKDEHKSYYNNRKYEKQVDFGVPWFCRVTAYKKAKNDGTTRGSRMDSSEVVMEYGRPEKVKSLEASFYEESEYYRSDARLDWSYSNTENIVGYRITRKIYEYDSSTKKYDKLLSSTILMDYPWTTDYLRKNNDVKKKYFASSSPADIPNGDLVEYTVQSIYYSADTALGHKGERGDGYVHGEPATVYYMNPTEVTTTAKNLSVGVGSTKEIGLKFKPKQDVKNADGSIDDEDFFFNDDVEYYLTSDDLTESQISKYVKISVKEVKDSDTGHIKHKATLKGIKKTKDSYPIYLIIKSKNDPGTVFSDSIRVKVTEAKSDESSGGEDDDDDDDDPVNLKKKKVCLDAGHGGKDDGAVQGGVEEKDVNLKLALALGEELKSRGISVVYTRTSDKFVELTERTDKAKDNGCSLFISLHCNSGSGSGTEVYYSVTKYGRKDLASNLSKGVANALGTNNRGAKTRPATGDKSSDYYSVIRTSAAKGIPGLIVEHGFLSNESDRNKLIQDVYIKAIAKAEADAIVNYYK